MSAAQTAIIFGGSGFLGHAVCGALARRGYSVRVPTRDLAKTESLKLMGLPGQILPFEASVRSDSAVTLAMAGCEVAINLIGSLSEKNSNFYQIAHVETAARLARLARELGVRHFVHVSALGAERSAKEAYAQTKARGEEAVRAFFSSAVILRPSLMFGPRDQFFNRLALLARFSPVLPLFGKGKARFQPTYVGDVAAAILAAIDRPEAAGGTFDVAGAEVYTLRALYELILKTTERHRWLMPTPLWLGRALAAPLSLLPEPPLTRDQLAMLQRDSITAHSVLADWGITPTPLAPTLQDYLC